MLKLVGRDFSTNLGVREGEEDLAGVGVGEGGAVTAGGGTTGAASKCGSISDGGGEAMLAAVLEERARFDGVNSSVCGDAAGGDVVEEIGGGANETAWGGEASGRVENFLPTLR
jgi:hypothetical protein